MYFDRILPLVIACFLFVGYPVHASGQTEKALFKRGLERMEQRNYSLGEIDFTMVLQLNPENKTAYYNRGFCRLRIGNYAAAIEDFSQSIEYDPSNIDAFFHRGIALRFIGDDVKQRQNLESARRVYLQALEDMNFTISRGKSDPKYLSGRAQVKIGLDDIRGAIQDLDMAIRMTKGRDVKYLYDRAEAFLLLKNFYEALDDLDRAIELEPRNPEGYMFRAAIKVQAGNQNGACLDWSRAGELGQISAYEYIRMQCGRE